MYKFTKTADPENEFDLHNTILYSIKDELDLTQLHDMFIDFARACGFHGVREFIEGCDCEEPVINYDG